MDNSKFCCVDDLPVLIPYRDLEKILEVAKNMEHYDRCISQVNNQLTKLRSQYGELLEKVRELEKMI